ncbi:MAG TPA: phenylalanine--tRNA ligase subunit beta [Candidatus Paceibacterota bacterium]|nr:phenylalanine--tRNA ligase subunit beta [Candidatus Paceibacterota bacterium]
MRISYNWIKTHFNTEIPAPEAIADALIFHSFEVEGIEKDEKGNTFLEIKILPDRAHDCLCHLGISREISALCGLSKPASFVKELADAGIKHSGPSVNIENKDLCRRYVGRVVKNIKVGETSEHIKELLAGIGQRSINNVVDAANFVMFEMGQPLHAFDLDKIVGNIYVRNAKKGEKMRTLDDKDLELSESILVIADEEGPLAIAGVKGGKRAGVTEQTKNIFLESANFEPYSVRRTSTRLNLRTDASKRFENDYSRVLAMEAIRLFSGLLKETCGPDAVFEDVLDVYPGKTEPRPVVFSAAEISALLGVKIGEDEILKLLDKTFVSAVIKNGKIEAAAPAWRLDLAIVPDFAEEVGRLYGYEKIPNILPEKVSPDIVNKEYPIVNKIKQFLSSAGFSEIYGYSLTDSGEVELDNPLASDKSFMRENLSRQLEEKINLNLRNSLFVEDPVSIFEIGNVFKKEGEQKNICIGIGYKTKKQNKSKAQVMEVFSSLFAELGIKNAPKFSITERDTLTILEFPLQDILNAVSEVSFDADKIINKEASYKKISQYPRSVRDIALFVPPETDSAAVVKKITNVAGPLLNYGPVLFDVFEKKDADGRPIKKSLAFRLVFQSYEKTLQDEDVNAAMSRITEALKSELSYEIR